MSELNVDRLRVNNNFTFPVYTDATRPTHRQGLLIFNSDEGKVQISIDGEWLDVGTGKLDGSTPDAASPSPSALLAIDPNLPSGNYYIKPLGAQNPYLVYCDLQGSFGAAGRIRLVAEYPSYSIRYSSCGGPADGDCSPDTNYPTPYYQGGAGEVVAVRFQDVGGNIINDNWMDALASSVTLVDSQTRHWTYDAENYPLYGILFGYYGGTQNSRDFNNNQNWQPGIGSGQWTEYTTEGQNMYTGGQSNTYVGNKILKTVDIGTVANWGWHIRHTTNEAGGYGIWVTMS